VQEDQQDQDDRDEDLDYREKGLHGAAV
jgi:hypothetical protein